MNILQVQVGINSNHICAVPKEMTKYIQLLCSSLLAIVSITNNRNRDLEMNF